LWENQAAGKGRHSAGDVIPETAVSFLIFLSNLYFLALEEEENPVSEQNLGVTELNQ